MSTSLRCVSAEGSNGRKVLNSAWAPQHPVLLPGLQQPRGSFTVIFAWVSFHFFFKMLDLCCVTF